jgi:hypothetical protein
MPDPSNDPNQTSLALAALTACIVRTLGEQDATFLPRFLKHTEDIYYEIRDSGVDHLPVLETLRNVQELLNTP